MINRLILIRAVAYQINICSLLYFLPQNVGRAKTESTFDINVTNHYGGYALRKLFPESDRLLIVKYVSST